MKMLEATDTFNTILQRIADGETLRQICRDWDVPWSLVNGWIAADGNRQLQYDEAEKARDRNHKDQIVAELMTVLDVDISKAFDSDGKLLPLDQIPEPTSALLRN